MRVTGTLICSTGAVAGEHFPTPPASKPHEVLLLAALSKPAVGECVAEHMRMQVIDTCLFGSSSEHLVDAVVLENATASEPKMDAARKAMLPTLSEGKQSGEVDHAAWGGIHGLAVRASRMASMGRRPWLRALTR